eukprot:SM000075S21944  [mRNA]  locus=s75:166757:167184:- [translate_table: standard]
MPLDISQRQGLTAVVRSQPWHQPRLSEAPQVPVHHATRKIKKRETLPPLHRPLPSRGRRRRFSASTGPGFGI